MCFKSIGTEALFTKTKWTSNKTLILACNAFIPSGVLMVEVPLKFPLLIMFEYVPSYLLWYPWRPQMIRLRQLFSSKEVQFYKTSSVEYERCCTQTILCLSKTFRSKSIENAFNFFSNFSDPSGQQSRYHYFIRSIVQFCPCLFLNLKFSNKRWKIWHRYFFITLNIYIECES